MEDIIRIIVTSDGIAGVVTQLTHLEKVLVNLSNTVSMVGTRLVTNINRPILTISDALDTGLIRGFTNINAELKSLGTRVAPILDRFKSKIEDIGTTVNRVFRTFDARLLSTLFFGMELQRTFGGALNSLFKNFAKVESAQHLFTVKTNELNASWIFLKFSIIDALSQSDLFVTLIDWLVSAVNWLSELINKHTWLGLAIVGAFAVLAGGGAVMKIISEFMLFWNSVFGIGGFLAKETATGMGTTALEKGTTMGAVGGFLKSAATVIGAGLLIYGIFETVKSITDPTPTPIYDILKNAFMVGAGVGLLTWNPMAGILASGIVLIILLLSEESKKTIKAINEAFTTEGAYQLPEQTMITGYTGTVVPEWVQKQQAESWTKSMGTEYTEANPRVTSEIYAKYMADAISKSITDGFDKSGSKYLITPVS